MAFDLFSSLRSTAIVTVVAASFTSPMVMKSDAFANASAKLSGRAPAAVVETVVAGGVAFALPDGWGATSEGGGPHDAPIAGAGKHGKPIARLGSVVSQLCPGGATGAACATDAEVSFVVYDGKDGAKLPAFALFEKQLDTKLVHEFDGFVKGEARVRPGADGIQFLDYSFTYRNAGHVLHQRFSAFRHLGGSGVVVMASGAQLADHAKELSAFLASAHEPVEGLH